MKLGLLICALTGVLIWAMVTIKPSSFDSDPYSGILIAETEDGQGSCFIVAKRGEWWYAVTAGHVVQTYDYNMLMQRPVSTVMIDTEQYSAEIIRVSSHEDVALIRFKSPEDYKIYSFAKAKVGDSCKTVGWSGGSRLIYKGYIVSLNFQSFITANGGVFPGCSGGALLNEHGRVIGVTAAVPTYSGSAFDSSSLYVPARFAEALVVTIGD